jgi:ZIP family zinc transporter
MSDTLKIVIGLLLPVLGTALGASMVFFLKNEMKESLKRALLGFASGVMIAASVWSLLIPAIDMAEESGNIAWLPALVGFLLGIAFLLVLDIIIPHLHASYGETEGRKCNLGKSMMLILAVTLHNIPEGFYIIGTLLVIFSGGAVVFYYNIAVTILVIEPKVTTHTYMRQVRK